MFDWIIFSFYWLQSYVYKLIVNTTISVLAAGPIPQHVAFVMDGNRRFARKKHLDVSAGHSEGFEALKRMLELCMYLHIRCVTVYAFSIENFKRSPEEVNALMQLAKDRLLEICEHGDLLDRHGVRLNILGRTSMLPKDVQDIVRKAEEMTRGNDKAILNLCMPYTSRDEMATAMRLTVEDSLASGQPIDAITESTIDAHLMTSRAGSPPLDVLVRTSGVKRLSDFLLWQCCEDTQIHFVDTYWPDFALRDFVPVVLDYQRKVWARRRAVARS